MDQQILKENLDYAPNTGIFNWKRSPVPRIPIGTPAGCLANGYIQIRFKGQLYYAHRLAYLYMTGSFPKQEIDHVNQNKSDNRWANLREVSGTENQRNTSKSKNNTSGFTGVTWDKRKNRWMAKIMVDRKSKFLGYFKDLNEAATVRAAANKKYNFHPNHGI
jgi:hypothetical protein